MAAFMTALPVNAFASEQVVDPAENDSFEVVASATVTDADLTELGLNVVVSFPVEIALTLRHFREQARYMLTESWMMEALFPLLLMKRMLRMEKSSIVQMHRAKE